MSTLYNGYGKTWQSVWERRERDYDRYASDSRLGEYWQSFYATAAFAAYRMATAHRKELPSIVLKLPLEKKTED